MSSFLIKHYFWRGENYRVAYSYTVMADQEDIPFRVCFEPLFPHKPVKKSFLIEKKWSSLSRAFPELQRDWLAGHIQMEKRL